jgi:phosphopantetheinyl transferase
VKGVISVLRYDGGALVVYAPVTDVDMTLPLYPPERAREVESCVNDESRREKYLVWRLLETVVKERFNVDFANLKFTKLASGKWVTPDFFFSLSHTGGAVCVAVSQAPVGVDIERVRSVSPRLYRRCLTERELSHLDGLTDGERNDLFLEAWVKKESLFKLSDAEALMPRSLETEGAPVAVHRVSVEGREYLLAVATENEKYKIIYKETL